MMDVCAVKKALEVLIKECKSTQCIDCPMFVGCSNAIDFDKSLHQVAAELLKEIDKE